MAKKSDILLKYYNDFPDYLEDYKTRSDKLERDFLRAKNDYQSYLDEIDQMFLDRETNLQKKFLEIEQVHKTNLDNINNSFNDQFDTLIDEVNLQTNKTEKNYDLEETTYTDILEQFESRKKAAFDTYVKLTNENNQRIDSEMQFHREFIKTETDKLNDKHLDYQKLNSNLSNKLLHSMQVAKESLTELTSELTKQSNEDKAYLDQTINTSIANLDSSKTNISKLFKSTTIEFERQRNELISKRRDKRKPHSELNQTIIASFVKQIKEVKKNKIAFDKDVSKKLQASLETLYPKIIEAEENNNQTDLSKYIMQKEIIERKCEYLLKRNQSMTNLLVTKYQNEIKKIRIDSFKRYEEIQTTYSVPVAFYQNSVNVYSNFAFYLNETYEEIYRMLNKFKSYNKDFVNYKTNYIESSQKSYEDYKTSVLIRVNEITENLTDYIEKIDDLSHKIVTLESKNRIEISEIKKKMENLDIYGDYQKYIASLERDQTLAIYQHNKNRKAIQIEANYTNNLLDINKEVLSINQAKVENNETQRYLLEIANHELEIQELNHLKKIEEAKAKYRQQIDQIVSLRELAKQKIIHNAMKTNYAYASSYHNFIENEQNKNQTDSKNLIDFTNKVQRIIDLNLKETEEINKLIKDDTDELAYIKALEETKADIIKHIKESKNKLNVVHKTTATSYETEVIKIKKEIKEIFDKYSEVIKNNLIVLQTSNYSSNFKNNNGYKTEVSSLFNYGHKSVITLAYKYQIASQVVKIDDNFEKYLGEFLYRNIETFKKLNKKDDSKSQKILEEYYIVILNLIKKYHKSLKHSLDIILSKTSANDLAFIDSQENKSDKHIQIVNEEYEKLQFHALKHQKNHNKQIEFYKSYSDKINTSYQKQVTDLNKIHLKQVKTSEELRQLIYKEFSKVVEKNNKELKNMVKFMDKMFEEEQIQIDKQYEAFKKSLSNIKSNRDNNYISEVAFIKTLYNDKLLEADKTIKVLDEKIVSLPTSKVDNLDLLDKEKNSVLTLTEKDLNNKLSEIEKEKYINRPIFLSEIENIKNRLPDDYNSLYNQIQELEIDFLTQYQATNDFDTLEKYQANQDKNNQIIDEDSSIYHAMDNLNEVNKNLTKATNDTYKETIQKSIKTRNKLKKEQLRSKEKQNRIINQ